MKNVFVIALLAAVIAFTGGCAARAQTLSSGDDTVTGGDASVSEDVLSDAESLYAFQENYANGVSALIEIPFAMAESVYDNYDELSDLGSGYAPVLLREYALTNTVYFDYDSGYSICWDKGDNVVSIEKTDMEERESYKEKKHKM